MPKIYKPKKKKNQRQNRSMTTRSVSPDYVGNALNSLVMQVSSSRVTQTEMQRLALSLRVFILMPPSLGLGFLFLSGYVPCVNLLFCFVLFFCGVGGVGAVPLGLWALSSDLNQDWPLAVKAPTF